jgi:hypothetical protein
MVPAEEVPILIEVVVDGGANLKQLLQCLHQSELLHCQFPSSV